MAWPNRGNTDVEEGPAEEAAMEERQPVPFRDRLSIWLIALVAFGTLLCMAATVLILAVRLS